MSFKALVLEENDGKVAGAIQELDESRLPEGDVTVRVTHSTLNYKDGMVLKGIGRLVRNYPHIPGIDFAGTVEASDSPDYKPGDSVLLTGWRVGEAWWGGYAEKARVKSEWLVPMPKGLDARRAMAIGTAGFTSMLCVMALEDHGIMPASGEVLVTGAAGGVGSVAVAILAKLGYDVAASTGRAETHDYLRALGAKTIVDRAELSEGPAKPLLAERFAGAVDTVGSKTLVSVLAQIKYGGSVAACGLAQGPDLPGMVIPFLLRGVNLLGIDSVMCPAARRREAWGRLVKDLPAEALESAITEVPLEDLPGLADGILKGQVRGRTVVRIGDA
ncbi:MAG: oxidoreductase [Proteobacteria bacterium]|nr:oxidoreductase [Pseudomonadota bacterium]